MLNVVGGGAKPPLRGCCSAIAMEIWQLPTREFGSFVAGIPAPLGIGMVKLTDGGWVQGVVCEAAAVAGGGEHHGVGAGGLILLGADIFGSLKSSEPTSCKPEQ